MTRRCTLPEPIEKEIRLPESIGEAPGTSGRFPKLGGSATSRWNYGTECGPARLRLC
jgi:hypothetical protein